MEACRASKYFVWFNCRPYEARLYQTTEEPVGGNRSHRVKAVTFSRPKEKQRGFTTTGLLLQQSQSAIWLQRLGSDDNDSALRYG